VLTAPRSPWQSPFVERVIGSIRRECLDHLIVWHERSLRRYLQQYLAYYHEGRKCMQRRSFSWRRGRVGSGPHRRGLNGEFASIGILPVNPSQCRSNATLRGRLRIRGWLQVLARIVSPGWAHGGPLTLTRLQCGRRRGGNILRSGSGRRLKIPAIVQRARFLDFRTSGRVVEAAASVSAATVLAVASRTAEGCGLSGLSCTAGCEGCLSEDGYSAASAC
jgi:hypothetical protein